MHDNKAVAITVIAFFYIAVWVGFYFAIKSIFGGGSSLSNDEWVMYLIIGANAFFTIFVAMRLLIIYGRTSLVMIAVFLFAPVVFLAAWLGFIHFFGHRYQGSLWSFVIMFFPLIVSAIVGKVIFQQK